MLWFFMHSAYARSLSCADHTSISSKNGFRLGSRFWQILICVLGCCVLAQAQTLSPAGFDKDVPFPTATAPLGQRDSTALNELIAHLKAVGISPWTGMQATGQITYGEDSTSYSATLSILGTNSFRLDAQTATGQMSIRIHGRSGKIQEADGRQFPMLPDTAASGIFQFVQLRSTDFPTARESFIDRGPVVLDGISLHRMTVEIPGGTRNALTKKRDAVSTDLYFDPVSHLLVKSSNLIRLDGVRGSNFLRVITYGDYRKVGDVMIPFRYTQTLDGQKQWTLQLSEIQLNPDLKTTSFQF